MLEGKQEEPEPAEKVETVTIVFYFFFRVKNDLLFGSSFFSDPGGRV